MLMRPSYVLGGQNMIVAYTKAMSSSTWALSPSTWTWTTRCCWISTSWVPSAKWTPSATATTYLIPGIMEQVERTGVHSGDSICVYPPAPDAGRDRHHGGLHRPLCPRAARHRSGQCAVRVSNGKVYVIEVNPALPVPCRISPRSPACPWSIWPCAAAWAKS